MIHPTELRIGNCVNTFINTTNGKLYSIGIVKALHINTCELENGNTVQYNMIEPIELNHSSISRIGFKLYNSVFYAIKIKGNYIEGWYLSERNELTKSISEFMVRVSSIHELQNLLFSLTKIHFRYD